MPLISVVIPCYNQAHFLGEAIASVVAQGYPHIEIVLVDDGSLDDPAAVAAAFPGVRCIRQENRGLAAARNRGLAECHGEMVVFLDADDKLLPGAVEAGVRLLTREPSVAFAAGHSELITGDGVPMPTQQPVRSSSDDPYIALLRRNSIRNPAMVMFRRQALEQAGGFDSRVDACADYEMYLRLSRMLPVRFHTTLVAQYRKHGGNMSKDAALMLQQLRVVLRDQRPHLVTPDRRKAFREGRQNIREYYGDLLANQIRDRLRSRSGWLRTCADVSTLLRCHPRGVVAHGYRKLISLWRGTRESTIQQT